MRTALPMILAEELEAELDRVELVQAMPGPDFPSLATSGSNSVRTLWKPLRVAGATAREMLVAAAAARWGVAKELCRAERGRVLGPSGRAAGYGELAAEAARQTPPEAPPLKPRERFRLVGRDRRRVDAPALVSGSALFAADVRLPGLLFATVLRPPVHGGKAVSWDASAATRRPGVKAVVAIPSGLAVIAEETWAALKGREALEPTIVWDGGPNREVDSATVAHRLEAVFGGPARTVRRDGDADAALTAGNRVVEAEYAYPFQAHTAVETPAAVAHVTPEGCEVWAGTQAPNHVQADVAKALGLLPAAVRVHVTLIGGGFGRRGSSDFVLDAVACSTAAGAPVQVLWTRADDVRKSPLHPISRHCLRAALDSGGRVTAWRHTVAAPSLTRANRPDLTEPQLSRGETRGALDLPYGFPAVAVDYAELTDPPVPLGAWRGVQHVHNVFAVECFVDELAHAAGRDPYLFRRELLERARPFEAGREAVMAEPARLAAVLRLAAEKAGWRPRRDGVGQGIACSIYAGWTYAALVAEVEVTARKELRVRRVVCAADCGEVVNPLGLRAQVEGSVVWGLSALRTEVTLRNGRVEQASYRDVPVLRVDEAPPVETYLVPSAAPPVGMGEPLVPLVAPAVLNAVFAAAGVRVRRVPIGLDGFRLAPARRAASSAAAG